MTICRVCDRRFEQTGKGRPRTVCTECRPPGAPKVSRVLADFRRKRAERTRALTAARGAAYRRVALAHPVEYKAVLEEERARRLAEVTA